jgi:hypothetical protein
MHWPVTISTHKHTRREVSLFSTYLLHHIPQLLLNLLFRALKPLPQIIADTSPLQQHLQRLLGVADLHNAVDVLGCAAQVRGEPGFEGGGAGLLPLAVERGEDGEGAYEDHEVGDGDGEHKPVDEVEGPHAGRGGWWWCYGV